MDRYLNTVFFIAREAIAFRTREEEPYQDPELAELDLFEDPTSSDH
jgi:hypothetical protein